MEYQQSDWNGNLISLSGSLGNLVFRQMPNGATVVSRKPDFSNRKFSQEQKDHQSRFKQAVAYAREAAKSSLFMPSSPGGQRNPPKTWRSPIGSTRRSST